MENIQNFQEMQCTAALSQRRQADCHVGFVTACEGGYGTPLFRREEASAEGWKTLFGRHSREGA